MNLTVGPLPPAVYWRRRALVLGVVLLLVILLVSMCGGRGGASKDHAGLASSSPTSSPTPGDGSRPPILGGPGSATGTPGGTGADSATPDPGGATPPSGASVDPSVCTDAEILLTPSIEEVAAGNYPYQMTLKIRNTSKRTCKRDVGAGPQELHITDSAGHVVWSSDYCQNGAGGSDVRTFGPNIETPFKLVWDGDGDGPGCVKGTRLPPGSYQLVAKLGTKVSAPVGFTVKPGDAVGS
jgi:hypothetical protein